MKLVNIMKVVPGEIFLLPSAGVNNTSRFKFNIGRLVNFNGQGSPVCEFAYDEDIEDDDAISMQWEAPCVMRRRTRVLI